VIALLAGIIQDPGSTPLGIATFRAFDRNGQACAGCHSPDGIELRQFSREAIRRRTARHFPDPEPILRFIQPPAPAEPRPFQPARSFLSFATPVQRDAAFAKHLKSRLPILMGRRIDSLAKAESAVDEIRAIDLFTLPIGIPFNQLSEDIANGKPHATIADWLPDTPVSPGYAVQDAYLASPTRENLVRLTTYPNQASGSAEILSRLKYQSLMRYVHFLKTGQRILTKGENPFWQIGEFGRLEDGHPIQDLGFPASVVRESGATKMVDLRLPWYWLGWMFDPGLQNSGLLRETKRADYFVRSLQDDGPYPAHTVFMLTRKLAEQGTNPDHWVAPYPQQFEIQYSFWLLRRRPGQLTAEAKTLEANSFRISLWILERDIARTGQVIRPESQLTQVKLIREELARIGQPEPALCDRVTRAIQAAKPLR
jgi:hypothetical protein